MRVLLIKDGPGKDWLHYRLLLWPLVSASPLPSQCLQKITHGDFPVRIMTHGKIWVYPVPDAPALFLFRYVTISIQVSDYFTNRTFGNADID